MDLIRRVEDKQVYIGVYKPSEVINIGMGQCLTVKAHREDTPFYVPFGIFKCPLCLDEVVMEIDKGAKWNTCGCGKWHLLDKRRSKMKLKTEPQKKSKKVENPLSNIDKINILRGKKVDLLKPKREKKVKTVLQEKLRDSLLKRKHNYPKKRKKAQARVYKKNWGDIKVDFRKEAISIGLDKEFFVKMGDQTRVRYMELDDKSPSKAYLKKIEIEKSILKMRDEYWELESRTYFSKFLLDEGFYAKHRAEDQFFKGLLSKEIGELTFRTIKNGLRMLPLWEKWKKKEGTSILSEEDIKALYTEIDRLDKKLKDKGREERGRVIDIIIKKGIFNHSNSYYSVVRRHRDGVTFNHVPFIFIEKAKKIIEILRKESEK